MGILAIVFTIPFDMKAPDLDKRENEIGMKLAEALKTASVQRVVLLSGTSARLKERAGRWTPKHWTGSAYEQNS